MLLVLEVTWQATEDVTMVTVVNPWRVVAGLVTDNEALWETMKGTGSMSSSFCDGSKIMARYSSTRIATVTISSYYTYMWSHVTHERCLTPCLKRPFGK